MSLFRSWLHSLTLFLPRRLFPLIGATLQSWGRIYLQLWHYMLGYTAISASVVLINLPTQSAQEKLASLVVGLLGALLQITILSALLPSAQEKNFGYYMSRIRSHWLAILLPLVVLLIAMPLAFITMMLVIFMIGVFSGAKQPTPTPQCTELGCPPPLPADTTAAGLQGQAVATDPSTLESGVKTVVYALGAVSFVLATYMQFATIFYLDDTPGFGKIMRALGKAFGLLFRNLPFFALFFAIQLMPLVSTGALQKILILSQLSFKFRLATTMINPLVITPLALALNMQIYFALRRQRA